MTAAFRIQPILMCVAMTFSPISTSHGENPKGAWHFLNDPRPVQAEGRTFIGYVDPEGGPSVASYYQAADQWTARTTLREKWKIDDHISPTLLIRSSDRRLLAIYARGSDVFYHLSENPLDASRFGPARRIPADDGNFPRPLQISENGETKIFLFYRDQLGNSSKRPVLTISRDGGETWSAPRSLIDFGHWMYPKSISGDDGSIHLLITSNPHHMEVNNLHYVRYRAGHFYRADGSRIAGLDDLPLSRNQLDTVYQSEPGIDNPPFRASDIAVGDKGRPVIAGVEYHGEDRREHHFVLYRFDGSTWRREHLAQTEPISDHPKTGWVYFGGLSFDRADPDRVFYAKKRKGTFELFLAEREAASGEFQHQQLTEGSSKHQIRPWKVASDTDLLIWLEGELQRFNQYNTVIRIGTPE